jgi:hypothetical protein
MGMFFQYMAAPRGRGVGRECDMAGSVPERKGIEFLKKRKRGK